MKRFLIALMLFGFNATAMAADINSTSELETDNASRNDDAPPNLPKPEEALRPTDPCLTNDEGLRLLQLIEAAGSKEAGELPASDSARTRSANTRKAPPNYLPHING